MGTLWELFQEYQISKRKRQAGSLEEQVSALTEELDFVESLLEQIIPLVEEVSGRRIEPVKPNAGV